MTGCSAPENEDEQQREYGSNLYRRGRQIMDPPKAEHARSATPLWPHGGRLPRPPPLPDAGGPAGDLLDRRGGGSWGRSARAEPVERLASTRPDGASDGQASGRGAVRLPGSNLSASDRGVPLDDAVLRWRIVRDVHPA